MSTTASQGINPQKTSYSTEAEGQEDFFKQFGLSADAVLAYDTDGIHKGNLIEFKLNISDLNAVLFQAVKYLSKLRVKGVDVPASILLVDLNQRKLYKFPSPDYDAQIHTVYNTASSRNNAGFTRVNEPEIVEDYKNPKNAQKVVTMLRDTSVFPIRITEDCVVAWAERYYRELPGSTKNTFLSADAKEPGELRQPKHFAGKIEPYAGDSNEAFAHILDRLNDKLKKMELGAFYTPDPYVKKATELVRKAIARVPAGNDYVIIDRCAGSGNLERFLTEDELSHVIVNTIEEFEYLELAREFGDKVRAVIPPTYASGNPLLGLLRNGDALTEEFINGDAGSIIRDYVEDPSCSIIMFENPPYGEVATIESHNNKRAGSFGWKNSWVRGQMAAEMKAKANRIVGSKPTNDLASVFIWSAFKYYLRQSTDSYIVFAPTKYFKSQALVPNKHFKRGFLFNRKHFHTEVGAGVSVVYWANEPDPTLSTGQDQRDSFTLEVFDIDKEGKLVSGSANGKATPTMTVKTTRTMLSSLYEPLPASLGTKKGLICEKNGTESNKQLGEKTSVTPIESPQIIGYLIAKSFGFENADLNTQLTRCAAYDGHGFYLTKTNYFEKLPLFVVGRYPAAGRWWERGVINRCADNGTNFIADSDFLQSCLIYTALSRHNKILSFVGSNGTLYRNELCLDNGTIASAKLASFTLTTDEQELITLWNKVLANARTMPNYDPRFSYGLTQIDIQLNTSHKVTKPNSTKTQTVYDNPSLNGDIKSLKKKLSDYHEKTIAPKLLQFGLLA